MKLKPTPVNLFNEFKVIVRDMADVWDGIIDLVSSPVSRYGKVVHVRNLYSTEKT
jgi:formylmethanofuran dehydrogenase subunit E-like metal-binding protein